MLALTGRSFPNPKLALGVVMTYKQYHDTAEYIGVHPKEDTVEIIGMGHVLKKDAKRNTTINTTGKLLIELETELAKIPKRHERMRAPLIAQIAAIKARQ